MVAVAKAPHLLKELSARNIASWNAVITRYAQRGQCDEALHCYDLMQSQGLSPDAITYTSVLKVCGITREVNRGKQIHDAVVSQGLLNKDIVLGTSLIHMYAKCDVITKAQQVLDELPIRDVVSWNALIAGYTQLKHCKEALLCYEQMRSDGLCPDAITYTCMLKSFGINQEANRGKQLHVEIVSQGLLEEDVVLGTALVDMYARCGAVAKAREVMEELPVRDVVSWNVLINAYAQHDQGMEALDCYDRMQCEGCVPNVTTYTCLLRACGITREAQRGSQIHEAIVNQGLLGAHVALSNALVDMYAKCGAVHKARDILEELPIRDIVSWSALIGGYAQEGELKEVFNCYEQMRNEGLLPDAVTYSCLLKACAVSREVQRAQQIHYEIVSQGLLGNNVVLGSALVDMYAKCGAVAKARRVLEDLPIRDIMAWSALIAGYWQQGKGKEAMDCFQRMRSEGLTPNVAAWNVIIGGYSQQALAQEAIECFEWMQSESASPDAITFVHVLNACSHSGLVDKGQSYFEIMRKNYGITPDSQHQNCLIGLFGRAGHFDKAVAVIKKKPSSNRPAVWSALLGGCRKWGNVKLGRLAFDNAVQVDEDDASAYVLMANIYAAAGMQEDATKMEAMRLKRPSLEANMDGEVG